MIDKFIDKNIMVIDVGNTNTVIAIINDKGIDKKWRVSTLLNRTSDEYKIIIDSFFVGGLVKKDITNIIISSVVPSVVYELKSCINNYFKISAKIIGTDVFPDINISTSWAFKNLKNSLYDESSKSKFSDIHRLKFKWKSIFKKIFNTR